MKLAAIKVGKQIESFIKFGEESLNFIHDPTKFTPRLEIELGHDGDESKRSTMDLAKYISTIVTKWDLIADEESVQELGASKAVELGVVVGEPWPLTTEALCYLPIEFLGKIVEKINDANDPNANSSAPSGSFS